MAQTKPAKRPRPVDAAGAKPSTASKRAKHTEDATKPKSKPASSNGAASAVAAPAKSKKTTSDAPRPKPSLLATLPTETDFPRGRAAPAPKPASVKEREQVGDLFSAAGAAIETAAPNTAPAKRRKLDGDRERKRGREDLKGRSKSRDKGKTPAGSATQAEGIRVEHLNYKRLIVGTRLLTRVVAIRNLELIVALPNQLLGHIPIVNVSAHLTRRLAAAGESDASDDDVSDDEADADNVPTLADLFAPGQLLTAIVTSLRTAEAAKRTVPSRSDEELAAARRVELSLDPTKLNETLSKADLTAGYVLSACVKSREDNGYVLDLGVAGISTFVGFADINAALGSDRLFVGQVVRCRIIKVASNGRTCTVSLKAGDINSSVLSHAPQAGGLLPGLLVNALVTAVVPSGLNCKVLGFFDATIDMYHLGAASSSEINIGQKVRARVLWALPTTEGISFALSLLPHIVSPSTARSPPLPIGTVVDGVKIVRIDREWGLVVSMDEDDEVGRGFVHISRITDDRIDHLPQSAGPYALGTIHQARVMGHSPLDGLVQLSVQPSILAKRFLSVSDVKVGDVVKGAVRALKDNALFVEMHGNVDGVVWPLHYSDVKLKHPERKFRPGAAVNARIFAIDADKQRISLTLKKSLVQSEHPVCASFDDVKAGVKLDGVVSKIMDKALLVDLFGGLRVLVSIADAAAGFVKDLKDLFALGQTTSVTITSINDATQQLSGRIREDGTKTVSVDLVEIDQSYVAKVSGLHPTMVALSLQPSGVNALVTYARLAKTLSSTPELLRSGLEVGSQLPCKVIVTSKDPAKSLVMVNPVADKGKGRATAQPDLSIESLSLGQIVDARIVGDAAQGLLVQFGGRLRGRVHWTDVADDYDSSRPREHEHVQASIIDIDVRQRRVDLSLRDPNATSPRDSRISSAADVQSGQRIRGFVSNIADVGLFVTLGRGVTARVQIRDLFDDFVKEWKERFSLGQVVEGTVVSVDIAKNQVSLRLRSGGVDAAKSASTGLALADFQEGQVVDAVIKRIEKYGVFVRVEGSSISGLCHKSEVMDKDTVPDDWAESLSEGKRVKAFVLSIDAEAKRINFSLKPSRIVDADDAPSREDSTIHDIMSLLNSQVNSAVPSESEGEDDDDVEITLDGPPIASAIPKAARVKQPPTTLQLSTGFDFSGSAGLPPAEEDDSVDASSDDEIAHDDGDAMAVDKTGTLNTAEPSSVADYERLLLSEPSSSFLWIRYMSHHLQTSDVARAREVGRRALQTIHFREEDDRLNVWIALLNLENAYGAQDTVDQTLSDALQHNDPKQVYVRAAEVFTSAAKFERADDVHQRFVRKYGQSSKAWTLYGQFLLDRGRTVDARELLARSLKSLPKRKHLKVIGKFAQMEFRYGDAERGRTIFEGILDSHPKRIDLWYVYIDLETRIDNVAAVRSLYDRLLRKLTKPVKVKACLKRWLAYEKQHGDPDGVQAVIKRATDYVAGSAGAAPVVANGAPTAADADDASGSSDGEE